jgi:DNA-binding transcriptional LysR family regulator
MEDWNEPRLVLAVARAGSLTQAAKALGIDHSTVFRRLNALEERLGVRFFERLPGGAYKATAAGERMAAAAERIEDEAISLERDLTGRDYRLAGRLRVTSSETLAYRLLTREIASFRVAHPGIMVELVIDNRVLSLSRREADVALRPVRPKEGDLWGRKLADVAWTVYGSRAYLNENGFPSSAAELACHALVCWDENAVGIGAADWLASVAPEDRITYRTTSLVNQLVAAKAGIGLAVLPCYLGDPEADLVRALPDPVPELQAELWIVTHADLKRTARVRVFLDLVGGGLARHRDLFSGTGAS